MLVNENRETIIWVIVMSKKATTNKFNDLYKNAVIIYFTYGTSKQVNRTLKNNFKRLVDSLGMKWNYEKNKSFSLTTSEYSSPINPLNKLYLEHSAKDIDELLFIIFMLSDHTALKENIVQIKEYKDNRAKLENSDDNFRNWYLESDCVYQSLINFGSHRVLDKFIMNYIVDHCFYNVAFSEQSDAFNSNINTLEQLMIIENLPKNVEHFNKYKESITGGSYYNSKKKPDKISESYIQLSGLTMATILDGFNRETITRLKQLLSFTSQTMPLGILGYYLLMRIDDEFHESDFALRYHQNYMIQTLYDYNIIDVIVAMENHYWCLLTMGMVTKDYKADDKIISEKKHAFLVYPLEIRLNRRNGRVHLVYYDAVNKSLGTTRIDFIDKIDFYESVQEVKAENVKQDFDTSLDAIERAKLLTRYLWGVDTHALECFPCKSHDIKNIRITFNEKASLYDIQADMRNGQIINKDPIVLEISCLAPRELKPWIRRYYGFIDSITGIELFDYDQEMNDYYQLYVENKKILLDLPKTELNRYVILDIKGQEVMNKNEEYERHGALFHKLFSEEGIEQGNRVLNSCNDTIGFTRSLEFDQKNMSYLKDILPITYFEARYFKTILEDDHAQLFLTTNEIDQLLKRLESSSPKSLKPFPKDCFVYYDEEKRQRSLNACQIKYLQMLMLEIVEGHHEVIIQTSDGTLQLLPLYVEYSLLHEQFTLVGYQTKNHEKVNISMTDIKMVNVTQSSFEKSFQQEQIKELISQQKCRIKLSFDDKLGIPDRILNELSFLKKKCIKEDDHYVLEIYFDQKDETDLAFRILSYGPYINIEEQEGCSIKEWIIQRIQ